MKIYVAIGGYMYDHSEVLGAFTTYALAEAAGTAWQDEQGSARKHTWSGVDTCILDVLGVEDHN